MSYIHELMERLSGTSTTRPHDLESVSAGTGGGSLLIRMARDADATPLQDLAELDSARPVDGPSLIALADGEVWAAVSLVDGHLIADPFRATGPAVALLRVRAAQLRGPATSARRARTERRVWRRARA